AQLSIETITKMAGAEKHKLYLTSHTGNKGGRFDQAILKEYQANRKDRSNTPAMLYQMRDWMVQELSAISCENCEADDAMASAQYNAIKRKADNKSIICTLDKDLMMVPGLHLNWNSGEIIKVKGFGKIWIDDSKKQKKLKGYGTKFFWAQMLMGDTADNISGLPGVEIDGKMKPVGVVATELLLKHCKNDSEAFNVVGKLYQRYAASPGFMHWFEQAPRSFEQVFISEGQLLWMRRNKDDPMDFEKWLRKIK
ncbi:MAG TPA: hypothetical protein VNZ45_05360, partial [Bacteroidia bacterium]|nr:hypothetical protein [Bacteroidia bacterium]